MSNYEVTHVFGNAPVKSWTKGVEFEDEAKSQVLRLAMMPFIHKHVAVMPDVHAGIGATVGSVIATRGAVIPAAVGVDIGCGMIAQKTTLTANDLPDDLKGLRSAIEASVPHGRSNNGGPGDVGAWNVIPKWINGRFMAELYDPWQALLARHPKLAKANCMSHFGTLGTGNHFIEVCLDTDDGVWIMLHSGSRGIGGQIGKHFIELAKRDMEKWFISLPDKDLAYLPEGSEHFDEYCQAVDFAQTFAFESRKIMMTSAMLALADAVGQDAQFITHAVAVNCHHNYLAKEHHFGANVWVTRKGAVRARLGDMGIIPGSMGARSYIVQGLGNADSFHSCSHGAGRRMSRTEAKKRFTVADHEAATAGIECRKDADVVDETPMAYKDIDAVMAAQSDLVEVVTELRQVLCVKG